MSTDRPSRRRAMGYLAAAGAAALTGVATLMPRKANAYYSGPVSDHFNGEQFFNPGGGGLKNFGQLSRLYMLEKWPAWPAVVPASIDKPPPSVTGASLRIVHVGHASWLLQTAGRNILIDPHWSDRASPVSFAGPKRANPPGIDFSDLPRIDVVLVTHNHYDHLDIPTLARLWQRDRPRIVTPLGNDTIMRSEIGELRADAIDWGDAVPLAPGLVVHAEPTLHWSARGARDRRHALWASFVIETPAGKVYAIGDTGFGDGRTFRQVHQRHPRLAVALIPIGAYEPRWFMRDHHINPEEAVRIMELVGAPLALGHHWGTFRLTTEPHDQPPKDLAAVLQARGHATTRFRPVQPGMVVAI